MPAWKNNYELRQLGTIAIGNGATAVMRTALGPIASEIEVVVPQSVETEKGDCHVPRKRTTGQALEATPNVVGRLRRCLHQAARNLVTEVIEVNWTDKATCVCLPSALFVGGVPQTFSRQDRKHSMQYIDFYLFTGLEP